MIKELSQIGVTLSKSGDEIALDGPRAVLTDALVKKLRTLKSDILRTLAQYGFGSLQELWIHIEE